MEILTNEKIKNDNYVSAEPLSNYYSILAQCNFKTGKLLMLDKEDILRKYITINCEANKQDKLLSKNDNNTLKSKTKRLKK